jgi:hypothetical protein
MRFVALSKRSKGAQGPEGRESEQFMKALILYVLFVTIGALISIGIGYYVEIEFSSTASLIVFLALFFANFAVSWLAVILVMDGTFKDAQGRQAHRVASFPVLVHLRFGPTPFVK